MLVRKVELGEINSEWYFDQNAHQTGPHFHELSMHFRLEYVMLEQYVSLLFVIENRRIHQNSLPIYPADQIREASMSGSAVQKFLTTCISNIYYGSNSNRQVSTLEIIINILPFGKKCYEANDSTFSFINQA